jgi:hypothetical protein
LTRSPSGRNLRSLDIAIACRLHLFRGRQIDPQLEAAQASFLLLRHFGMDDAAPGGHPLHAAAHQFADIAQMILVPQMAVEHIRRRLEAAVRMRRKAGDIVARIVGRKFIEHQERIQPQFLRLPQAASQFDAGAVRCGDGCDNALQST